VEKCMQLLSSYLLYNEKTYGLIYKVWKGNRFLMKLSRNWSLDFKVPRDFFSNYSHIQACIGLVQLGKVREIIERRIAIAKLYYRYLKDIDQIVVPPLIEGASYSHYSVLVPNRRAFVRHMEKNQIHIGTVFDYSIPHTANYSSYRIKDDYTNSLKAARHVVNLPIYPSLKRESIKSIVDAIEEWTSRFGIGKTHEIGEK
jgi:dTDP-4-amino-4,6-dideoxygalactose transaminase